MPTQNAPGMGVINDLAYAVQRNLPECRRLWWDYHRNDPATAANGACCLNNRPRLGTTIVEASYDPATCETLMRLADGFLVTVAL